MAELQQPWIYHLKQGKDGSAVWLCLLRGCQAHPASDWRVRTRLEEQLDM